MGQRVGKADSSRQVGAGVIDSNDRFASAEEIGDFVSVLVSEKQGGMGWMAGSDVVVDGGGFGGLGRTLTPGYTLF